MKRLLCVFFIAVLVVPATYVFVKKRSQNNHPVTNGGCESLTTAYSDAYFSQMRAAIDEEFNTSESPWDIYINYQQKVDDCDVSTYFAWGYSAYKFAALGIDGRKANQAQYDVLKTLKGKELPTKYEFSRMQFLITAQGKYPQELKPLGERLLKHTPHDYSVQLALGKILADSPTKEGRKAALIYAENLAKQYPQKAGAYSLLGRTYDALWVSKDMPAARPKAIAAYKKYLTLIPSTPRNIENRRNALTLIKVAQRGHQKAEY